MTATRPDADPIHLRPSAPVAADALLPGDPGRALALAQALLTKPLMSNHARGLWGYYGETESGRELTIQATGMGGPSAAIVLSELARLGVRRAVRVGTCGALDSAFALGQLLVVTEAIADDGTSQKLGAGRTVEPDPDLRTALGAQDAEPAKIATTDLFYDGDSERGNAWIDEGAQAVEMEAAALFALGPKVDVRIGCLLVVSDLLEQGVRRRIGDEELAEAGIRMGKAAADALADG